MPSFNQTSYFFEKLLHPAFIGKLNQNGSISIERCNIILNNYIDIGTQPTDLEKLANKLFPPKIAKEYCKCVEFMLEQKTFKGNFISVEFNSKTERYSVNPIAPEGIPSLIVNNIDWFDDDFLYLDVFTIPQIDEKNIVRGIQAMFPIVNRRRKYYIDSQNNIQLNLFHHLKNNLKFNVLDKISEIKELLSRKSEEYFLLNEVYQITKQVINQSTSVLKVLNKSILEKHKYKNDISDIYDEFEIKYGDAISNITLNIQDDLVGYKINVPSQIIIYLFNQFVENAEQQFERKNIPLIERNIEFSISLCKHESTKSIVKFRFYNSYTHPNTQILSEIGIRPIKNTYNTTGLGYYFLNFTLALFGAIEFGERYFRPTIVKEPNKGFEVVFLLNARKIK